jgi:putative transposase
MAKLRRFDFRDRLCFVTCVTADRKPLLLSRPELFLGSWRTIQPIAWVIMPDHFHAILPINSDPLTSIIQRFKVKYAWHLNDPTSFGMIWQSRFWDHWIRNEADLANHLDYIHINPVHHGAIANALDWKYSSLRQWYEQGYYACDWGIGEQAEIYGDFGE